MAVHNSFRQCCRRVSQRFGQLCHFWAFCNGFQVCLPLRIFVGLSPLRWSKPPRKLGSWEVLGGDWDGDVVETVKMGALVGSVVGAGDGGRGTEAGLGVFFAFLALLAC